MSITLKVHALWHILKSKITSCTTKLSMLLWQFVTQHITQLFIVHSELNQYAIFVGTSLKFPYTAPVALYLLLH